MELSRDALRLLYAISKYGENGGRQRWLKLHSLHVIVHLGVHSGAFADYDLAPVLFPFRGIKMFAMVSPEAEEDVELLLEGSLIEKVLLSSWFYATVTGLRATDAGMERLQTSLSDEDRTAVDSLVVCPRCGQLLDFAVCREDQPEVHLVMHRVCRCMTRGRHTRDDMWARSRHAKNRIDKFFSIGQVAFSSKPFYL